MNNLLKYALGLLMFAFISCNKDNVDDTIKVDDPRDPKISITNNLLTRSLTSTEGLEIGCFEVLYPFSLVDVNNVNYTIADEEDWNEVLQDSGLVIIVDFVYPITIADENGIESTIQNVEQLSEAFSTCLPDGGWSESDFPAYNINESNSCYTMSFPITLKKVDGSTVSAVDEEEYNELLASDQYFFVFPFSLKDENNVTITVNNTDELFNLLISCGGVVVDTAVIDWQTGFDYIGCYQIEFPLNIQLDNGTTVAVLNHQELCDIMLTGHFAGYAYPLSLISPAGQTITVNNEAELQEALNECIVVTEITNSAFILYAGTVADSTIIGGNETCYSINYPISVNAIGNGAVQTLTVNNDAELINIIFTGLYISVDVNYPVSVTLTEDNTVVTVNSNDELLNLLMSCGN